MTLASYFQGSTGRSSPGDCCAACTITAASRFAISPGKIAADVPTPCCHLLQGALTEERAGRAADAKWFEATLQAAADEAAQTAECYEDALRAATNETAQADETVRLHSAALARACEQLAAAQARLQRADHAAMTLFHVGCEARDQLADTRVRLQTADRAVMTLFRRAADAGQLSSPAALAEQPQQQSPPQPQPQAACGSWGMSAELQAALQAHPSPAAAELQVGFCSVLPAHLHATRLTLTKLTARLFGSFSGSFAAPTLRMMYWARCCVCLVRVCAQVHTNTLRGITRHLNCSMPHSTQEERPAKAAVAYGVDVETCAAQPAARASPCSPPASTAAQDCSQVGICLNTAWQRCPRLSVSVNIQVPIEGREQVIPRCRQQVRRWRRRWICRAAQSHRRGSRRAGAARAATATLELHVSSSRSGGRSGGCDPQRSSCRRRRRRSTTAAAAAAAAPGLCQQQQHRQSTSCISGAAAACRPRPWWPSFADHVLPPRPTLCH